MPIPALPLAGALLTAAAGGAAWLLWRRARSGENDLDQALADLEQADAPTFTFDRRTGTTTSSRLRAADPSSRASTSTSTVPDWFDGNDDSPTCGAGARQTVQDAYDEWQAMYAAAKASGTGAIFTQASALEREFENLAAIYNAQCIANWDDTAFWTAWSKLSLERKYALYQARNG
jgi:hypothetical protein